ncbi:MAG: hypothetical protein NC429_05475 [Lachnospiraceae bacterium]|nr:hypothetical protein [Lachnospiraceae bacterium]
MSISNRVRNKRRITLIIPITLIIVCGICTACFCSRHWTINDIYGQWKVTRLIYKSKGSYGHIPLGNEIGRSFTISESQITDSRSGEMGMQKGENSYSMAYSSFEKKKYANHTAFEKEGNIPLKAAGASAGIPNGKIQGFTFYSDTSAQKTYEKFFVFTYDYQDKDKLVVWLNGAYYLLERFKNAHKTDDPYGKWYVESMVSRGTEAREGLQFLKKYGKCYELAEESLRIGRGEKIQGINWHIERAERMLFEKENGIVEGLGVSDREIYVWSARKGEEQLLCVIPINNDEIITQINGQWFRLYRMDQYVEPSINWEEQLSGEWKFTQYLALTEPVEEQVISEYYTKSITLLDIGEYVKGAVTDWEIEDCAVSNFIDEMGRNEYFESFFSKDDIIHIARRKVYDKAKMFVIINHEKMIYSGNGVVFIIEKIQ